MQVNTEEEVKIKTIFVGLSVELGVLTEYKGKEQISGRSDKTHRTIEVKLSDMKKFEEDLNDLIDKYGK